MRLARKPAHCICMMHNLGRCGARLRLEVDLESPAALEVLNVDGCGVGEVAGHWNIGEYLVPSAHIYMLHIIEKFLFLFRDKWNSLGAAGLSNEERRAEVDSYMRVLISERLSVMQPCCRAVSA